MLRITTEEAAGAIVLRIEGKLCRVGAPELEACWAAARARAAPVRVQLASVTFVDDAGRALLARMHAEGVELRASGCATRGLVAEITGREPGPCE